MQPAFSKNNIPIAFATDTNYFWALMVALESLQVNSSNEYNYDIIVLEENLNENQIQLLQSYMKDKQNYSVRLIDMAPILSKYGEELFYKREYWSRAIYYRLFLPELLPEHEKLIYLDVDLLLLGNIKDLFSIDLQDVLLGGVLDLSLFRKKFITYVKKIKQPIYPYINSGVLLMNLKKMREYNIVKKYIKILQHQPDLHYPDQDIINIVCQGNIKLLNIVWNYSNFPFREFSSCKGNLTLRNLKKDYLAARSHIKILHYHIKPWRFPDAGFSDIWWSYVDRLPCADAIRQNSLMLFKMEYQALKTRYSDLEKSTSWKITLPLRIFADILKKLKSVNDNR